jgi:tetratricopeptide (TPR) repeat protein
MATFDDVLSLDKQNLMAHFNKGCSYLIDGLLEKAEQSFTQAASIDPLNFEILFYLGKTALELNHQDIALKALNTASELKGRQGIVFHLLGQARLISGDHYGAFTAFKQAVKFNPNDANSLSALGVLYREKDNDSEVALTLFQRSIELDPTNSLFRQRLGRLLFDLGNFQEAERHLRLALDYGCKAPEVHRHLELLAQELAKAENEENNQQSDQISANEPDETEQITKVKTNLTS